MAPGGDHAATGARSWQVSQASGAAALAGSSSYFDEGTRTKITQSLAMVHEQLVESLQPMIESARFTVLPVMQQISDFMPQVTSLAEKAGQMADFIRRWVSNWSGNVDPDKAWAVTAEGIPLAFVPHAQLVDELIAVNDRDARLEIMLRSKKLILSDCRAALQPDEDDPLPESISMLPPCFSRPSTSWRLDMLPRLGRSGPVSSTLR